MGLGCGGSPADEHRRLHVGCGPFRLGCVGLIGLEEIALRESIAARTTEWEEALVLAHHRLARTPRSLSESSFEDNPDWEPLHRAFHRALIAGFVGGQRLLRPRVEPGIAIAAFEADVVYGVDVAPLRVQRRVEVAGRASIVGETILRLRDVPAGGTDSKRPRLDSGAMPRVTYIHPTGERREVDVPVGQSLMRAAAAHGIDGIVGDCGGAMSCATCHVLVEEPHAAALPAPDDTESQMLDYTAMPRQANSRLSCQIVMSDALDGITVRIADTQL